MAEETDRPACRFCVYFEKAPVGWHGECRRFAPKETDSDGGAAWPQVTPGDWCGEFTPAPATGA